VKKVTLFSLLVLLSLLSFSQIGFSQLTPDMPRSETLICDVVTGRAVTPDNFNVWAATWRTPDRGIQQLMLEPLWMVDPATGKIINSLAKEKPAYNSDFTKMVVKLREGCYWSDGQEITADDLIFTVQLIMKYPTLNYNAQFTTYIDKIVKNNKYTVTFQLKKSNSRFHTYFLDRWGACWPLPKHVFEKVSDPASFAFNPPVSSGPYTLKSFDPGGYWTLWERRADWDKTPTGKLYGMPKPKYVLYMYYGPDEKKVVAQARHELDIANALSLEAQKSAFARNEYARAYRKDFPWTCDVDPCITGILFNNLKSPYNNKDVRWALTLTIDMTNFVYAAFDGSATMGALHVPSTPALRNWYYKPLDSWLKNFTLTVDNKKVKVYDPDIPIKLADMLRKRGYKITTDQNAVKEIFGYGWWKYAPDVAEKLLLRNGFKRDKNGKWLLPDGKPWKITIVSAPNPEDYIFTANLVAQYWKDFGIDTEVYNTEQATTLIDYGQYDVAAGRPTVDPLGGHFDLYGLLSAWHSRYVRPINESNPGHDSRWSNEKLDKIIDQMDVTNWDSVKTLNLGREAIKLAAEEMPTIPMIAGRGGDSFDEYYWTNYATAENLYCMPFCHWPNFKYMLPSLKPTGRK